MMSELRSLVGELERDRSLDEPDRLPERFDALDRLEALLIDTGDAAAGDAELLRRAIATRDRLEAVNARLYESIRDEILRGAGASALLRWAPEAGSVSGDTYDYLDDLLGGVLRLDQPAAETSGPAPEIIPYQPTPARHIFDLLNRAALTERDTLIDIGSGLGQVTLAAAICTEAQCIGIEREAAYVDSARWRSSELGVSRATFIHGDALEADLSGATVLYMYTPFTGSVLRAELDLIRREATSREIRVFTLGPCTPVVAREPWLEAVGPVAEDRVAMFQSRTPA